MSRAATITAQFIGDISDAEAKYNALVQTASKGIPVNFTGGPAGSGTSTLGGASVSSSAPFPTGAASPNFSFIGSQIAQQISAALAPALQSLTGSIPTSSPNWSNYFGGIQNQLQAMTPTSSPAWGPLLQSSMQSAMYPVGSSSPNWGYYASIAAGNRGGGGGGGGPPGFFSGGLRRMVGSAGFAIYNVDRLIGQADRNRSIEEAEGRGDTDEALSGRLAEIAPRRQGFTGLIRRAENSIFQFFGGDDRYDDESGEQDVRQAMALRRLDRTSLGAAARTRQLGYRTAAVGASDVARTAIEGQASLDSLTQEQIPQREQVSSLRNQNLGGQANQLERVLNAQVDAAKKLADAQTKEAERLQSNRFQGIRDADARGFTAARGFTTLAERQAIIDQSMKAIRDVKENDPATRAELTRSMSNQISAFDIGTAREFGFSADDAESRAGISRLRANRDTYGAERAGVESRRRVAMRSIPQNWFTDLLGGRRLRGALNDEFDAELGEIGAQENFENGGMQRGISGRNASLRLLLERRPLAARINAINAQRDQTIRNLRPDQEYLEGGIRTGARREGELATREEVESRALTSLRLSSSTGEILQQLRRNPLGAQILGIQTDTAEQVARAFGQGDNSATGRALLLGFARTGLAQRQFADLTARADLNLGGQRDQYQALLRHDPVGASVAGIVTSGLDESTQFRNAGMPSQQRDSLRNSLLQLQLTKQNFLESFHAVEIGQNFDTGSPRGTASMDQVFKDIQSGIDKLTAALKDAVSAK